MASLRILALWVGLVAAAHTTTADDDAPTQELTPSAPVARLLSREMPHTFRLELLPGQYVRLLVTKADLNLQLTVTEPSGRRLCEFVSWRYGTLRGSLVAANGGTHLLEVRSLEGDATAREYVIEVGELRAATERDMGDAAASQTHAEAERLRAEWAADSLREAIGRYAEAAAGWRANGSLREASGALLDAGDTAFTLSDYDAALDFYRRALALSRAAGDERGAAAALNSIGYVHSNTDNTGRALSYFRAVSALYRSRRPGRPPDEDLRGAAGLSNNVGEVYYYRGDLPRAKGYFNRALRDFAAAGDRRGQALADLNLGYTYLDSGDLYNSQAHLARALALWRAVNDKRGEALTTTAQGMLASFRGEKQSAFGAYKGAIQMFRAIGDRQGEAAALNSAGKAYEDLNEFESSLDQYTQALQLFQETGNADAEAVTQYYVGRAYHSLNDDERALRHYGESLSLSRRLGKRRIEQYVLTDMASIHAGRGQRPRALSEYGRVLRLYRGANDRRSYAHVLSSMADVYASPPTRTKALRLYRRALALVRAAGYHEAEASTLYKLARAERDSGDLPRARADVQAAIRISESLRTKVARRDLRSSYFASAHDQYVLYTDLLMRMHSQRPSEGFAAAALQASESARARMLLDILSEAEVDIRQGVAPELLERERSLQQSLAAKAESHALLRAAGDSEQEADEMEKEVRRLTTEYQEVTADIREQGLRNAYIVPPSALSLEEIQKELLDEDTLLLEYVLGDEKSYLWAVTPTSFSSYELPPGSEIGDAAGEVYRLLVTGREAGEEASADEQYWRAASAMSRMLLGGVASQLGRK
ncbi:MAG TPA: tetratricopeptide repeat protein, partial [Pyrinomonadaceae bacterium]|nr:tetratricopeptide repeat protein [Pyrinomonadaceae bacterium]